VAMFVYFYFVPKKQQLPLRKIGGKFSHAKKMMGLGAISFDKVFSAGQ
jgi:hypothetical protein